MKKRVLLAFFLVFILWGFAGCGAETQEPPAASEPDAPTWQEQFDLGIRYLSKGNYKEAIIAFTAAIEIDPKQAPAYVGRGDAYILSGETENSLESAQTDYKTALELDESNVDAYLGLADVYIRKGDFEKAEELLRQALEIVGDNQSIADKLEEFSSEKITDSRGNTRKTIWRTPDGAIKSYSIHYLDAENRRIRDEYYDADGALEDYNIITWREGGFHEHRYDPEGNLMYSTNHTDLQNDSEFYSRVDSYDENGTLKQYCLIGHNKTEHYDADGTPLGYEIYEYNEAGKQIKWLRYHKDGELYEYYVTEYDENGDKIRYTCYDADGKERSHIDYGEDEAEE